jgi:hypothetical protein
MSQNFSPEFHIPEGEHNPNSQMPIYDGSDNIDKIDDIDYIHQEYSKESAEYNALLHKKLNAERAVTPTIRRLKDITKNITVARRYRLDSTFFTYTDKKTSRFVSALKKMVGDNSRPVSRQLLPLDINKLIQEESKVGATIFGERPADEHIHFFMGASEEEGTYFHQQKIDKTTGKPHSVTHHYEIVQESGNILKTITWSDNPGINYEFIRGKERDDFILATEMYHDRVLRQVYGYELTDTRLLNLEDYRNNLDNSTNKKAA